MSLGRPAWLSWKGGSWQTQPGPFWTGLFLELCKSQCASQRREAKLALSALGLAGRRLGEIKNFSPWPRQMEAVHELDRVNKAYSGSLPSHRPGRHQGEEAGRPEPGRTRRREVTQQTSMQQQRFHPQDTFAIMLC